MFKISANKLTLEKASEMLIMNFQIFIFFEKKNTFKGVYYLIIQMISRRGNSVMYFLLGCLLGGGCCCFIRCFLYYVIL